CSQASGWLNLNKKEDFVFPEILFCRFKAQTAKDVTQDYEQNCDSVLAANPETNMFWLGLFKAEISKEKADSRYEEARIIHLLNTTRVRVGS
ncbi:MAG TPA: hypothetical protein VFV28_01285, partial [Limnobacter sp.]|nr:hypothetical protein [Limnobacter sp.]